MKKNLIFKKFFTREIPLIMMEYWNRGETQEFFKILHEATHFTPLFVRNENSMTDVYYDINNPDTALQPLFDYFQKNPEKFDVAVKNFETLEKRIDDLLNNFSFEKFKELFETTSQAWGYLPIWVQLGSATEEKLPKHFIETSLTLRDQFQKLEYGASHKLLEEIDKKYPDYSEYKYVISFEEAFHGNIPSKIELEKRQKGFIFFDGKLFLNLTKQNFAKENILQFDDDIATIGEYDPLQNIKKFEKIYTRDTTYIMQELWSYACSEGIEKEFNFKNPDSIGIIHHMNDGSIEIWENLVATDWLEEQILKKNIDDPSFINTVLTTYKNLLSELEKLWHEEFLSTVELKRLIELSRKAQSYFAFYYYSAKNEMTPNDIREKALEMRNRDEFFSKNDTAIRKSLLKLYPEIQGYETSLLIGELDSLPIIKVLEERRKSSFLIQGKNLFVGSMQDFQKNYPDFVFMNDKIENVLKGEIKGQIGQKGYVVGKVKILRRVNQINEVKEGDIIVSPMTTPDFLPAMIRAGAFITDEGGIMCHAGIVARELKKPCIIGTKIATQVLKDGDMVEVDANNGIVKII